MTSLSKDTVTARTEEYGSILYHYVNMAEVMAGMFSPFLETVVHDLSNRENSIIAIYNGNVTGREVGDPVTNVVTKLIEGNAPDIVIGYENEAPDGKKLKSSYVSIRCLSGELVGVLGLNMNIEDFRRHKKMLEKITQPQSRGPISEDERFERSAPKNISTPRSEIRNAIDDYCISKNLKFSSIGYDEKKDIVQHLYKEGYFNIKKSVTIVSELLNITRPSVYKYKKQVSG
jgi:predicted transcriptional regulator YheO